MAASTSVSGSPHPAQLARRLGLQENAVRRLLDLDHRSHIDQVDRALAALGRRLELRILAPL
ncbi:MAG TPA: hypothetical protein VFV80_08795 [Geminicoccaceae bacterium]|nr:hypothetical protein [Geminicoccaceae bacterium]